MIFDWNLITDLRTMWQWEFMRNAFEAGTIIAILSGIIGYFVVLRRASFATHALGHVGFSGAAAAVLYSVTPVYGLLLFTMGGGAGMALLGRRAATRDIEVGTVLAFMLGLGLIFLSLYRGFATTAYSILFGEILGVSDSAVELTVWVALAVIVALALIYRPLLFSSLDEDVAEARGLPMLGLNLAFMLLLAVVISFAVQVVGILLIFALIVTPAATAVRVTRHPISAVVTSVGIAVFAVWLGLFVSWYEPYPPSFFIVTTAFAAYLGVRGAQLIALRLFAGRRSGRLDEPPASARIA
jgi:zinc/manganese transport system permease protein